MGVDRKSKMESLSGRSGFKGDRRKEPRYSVEGAPARLAWPENGGYRTISVRLRDVSLGGASGLVDVCPPKESLVWICLRDDPPDEWIEAVVVQASRTRFFFPGPFLIHLKFSEVCPYDAFKATIDLLKTGVQAPAPASDRRG
jgi:hypothetical protein